jgi:single-stranded-DNA-specific exonuclease
MKLPGFASKRSTPMPEELPTVIVERLPGAAEAELRADLPPLLARIYAARGIESARELDLSLTGLLAPDALPGIEAAAARLARAVRDQEHIKIIGDFDADGATASALAVSALKAMGAAQVSYLVPNRFEFGYGLTPEIVELAVRDNPDLLVTVDNGVSSIAGAATARAAGLGLVITDHHLPGGELPVADAIVNPNLAGSEFGSTALAGVGVIFYVVGAVRSVLRAGGWFEDRGIDAPNIAEYLDLVALGTVADVVPLDRNNRILVQQGLRRIRAGRARPGIRALCEAAGRDMGSLRAQDIGFALAPRLNAAGRLDDMSIGIRCLLAETLSEARSLATGLEQLNQARRAIQQEMTSEAELLVANVPADTQRLGLCVYESGWHQGVVGIVAGRLRERFHRPVIAFADAGDVAPDELKGSARSISGVHVRDALDAIAARFPGLIVKFGGHAMAAGLSIRRIHYQRFAAAFADEVERWVTRDEVRGVVLSDGELGAPDIHLDNAERIADAGPWGQAFPEPVFHGDFELVHQRVVGEKHTRLTLRLEGSVVDAIAFNQLPLAGVKRARIAYQLDRNDYREQITLQLRVVHIEALQS